MSHGKRIHELRTRLGLSQGDLAQRVGVKRNQISAWENGAGLSVQNTIGLAIALNTSTDYLLTGKHYGEVA